jgi:hypothetical protein
MSQPRTRRAFLAAAPAVLLSPAPFLRRADDKPPPLSKELVEAFVRVAHKDLVAVRAMIAEERGLLNAVWDWGGGDFESAIGAAAHMGSVDIANFLLDEGARIDIPCAVMLGREPIVRAYLDTFPDGVRVPGAHGISLIKHAENGDQPAMMELLRSYGAV